MLERRLYEEYAATGEELDEFVREVSAPEPHVEVLRRRALRSGHREGVTCLPDLGGSACDGIVGPHTRNALDEAGHEDAGSGR
jgi:hypothetical protein